MINDMAGEVIYSGSVVYKDGTTETIESTVAETNTILVTVHITYKAKAMPTV